MKEVILNWISRIFATALKRNILKDMSHEVNPRAIPTLPHIMSSRPRVKDSFLCQSPRNTRLGASCPMGGRPEYAISSKG